jgi:hypothetical protein
MQPSPAEISSAASATELPVFVVDTVVFPAEPVTLDMRTGSMMALAAHVSLQVQTNPDTRFCIATSLQAPVGTVAHVDPKYPFLEWVGHALRLRIVGLSGYYFVRNGDFSAGFPNIIVRQFADIAPPVLAIPIRGAFPFCRVPTATEDVSRARRESRVRTRSSLRSSKMQNLRGSTIDLEYRIWRSFQDYTVLQRLRVMASSVEGLQTLDLDENLVKTSPKESDSPARWSFWFAAAISAGIEDKLLLLSDRLAVGRLRRLCALLCDAGPKLKLSRPRKRPRRAEGDPQYRRVWYASSQFGASHDVRKPKRPRAQLLRVQFSPKSSDGSPMFIQKPWPTYCMGAFVNYIDVKPSPSACPRQQRDFKRRPFL